MNILIISEYIAPANEIASIRWTKIGKYLGKEFNCKVDILTTQKDFEGGHHTKPYFVYDNSIASDLRYFNNVYEINNGFRLKILNIIRNLLKAKPEPTTSATHLNPSQGVKKNQASQQTSAMERLFGLYTTILNRIETIDGLKTRINWSKYNVIISTYGPYWPHNIAKAIKKKHPNIKWIADYRDSLFSKNDATSKKDSQFIKDVALNADCILSVSRGVARCVIGDAASKKSVVLPNGYDPDELASRKRMISDKFTISYTGTLYNQGEARRDLRPLFDALTDLIRSEDIDPSDLEFIYCGNSENEFLSQISPYSAINWRNLGRVSRKIALNVQERSSLLALSTWNTADSQGIVTGKVFEYFSSGVPIVCLCSGNIANSELSNMIENANGGVSYEEPRKNDDFYRLRCYLKDQYDEWKLKGITRSNLNNLYISQYSYNELASKLYQAISTLK